ncbi:hypothetical protein AC579_2496 [Pseudocercospora musae]|uniref:Uncharacterized protein n=1 Tax=Pseudocercospora musae TaxID=113226 RepID=A0A139IEW7_9PEZI|nr:hypothetical protein AC579_2496 [Pseudocercospora musae]
MNSSKSSLTQVPSHLPHHLTCAFLKSNAPSFNTSGVYASLLHLASQYWPCPSLLSIEKGLASSSMSKSEFVAQRKSNVTSAHRNKVDRVRWSHSVAFALQAFVLAMSSEPLAKIRAGDQSSLMIREPAFSPPGTTFPSPMSSTTGTSVGLIKVAHTEES